MRDKRLKDKKMNSSEWDGNITNAGDDVFLKSDVKDAVNWLKESIDWKIDDIERMCVVNNVSDFCNKLKTEKTILIVIKKFIDEAFEDVTK